MIQTHLRGTTVVRTATTSFSGSSAVSSPLVEVGTVTGSSFSLQRRFAPGQDLVIRTSGFVAGSQMDVFVVPFNFRLQNGVRLVDQSTDAETDPAISRGLGSKVERLVTGANGTGQIPIWSKIDADALNKHFHIILDRNLNGTYESSVDLVQNLDFGSFVVVDSSRGPNDNEVQIAASDPVTPNTQFQIGDRVWMRLFPQQTPATLPSEGTKVLVCIVADRSDWSAGLPLNDLSGPGGSSYKETAVFDDLYGLGTLPIYASNMRPGKYDIVIDVNRNGVYDPGTDFIDGSNGYAFEVQGIVAAKPWTVMIYLAADNDLEPRGVEDYNEIETALSQLTGAERENINVVVQMDRSPAFDTRWNDDIGCNRYIVTPDTDLLNPTNQALESLEDVNMGDPAALEEFIQWGKRVAPAEKYAMVLWDHGSGFRGEVLSTRGIAYDDTSGDSLQIREIASALGNSKQFEVLAMDACSMGSLDVLDSLKDTANYIYASQNTIPGEGLRYDLWIKTLGQTPGMTGRQLSSLLVNNMQLVQPISLSIASWETSKIPAMVSAFEAIANRLMKDPDGAGPLENELQTGKAFGPLDGLRRSDNYPDFGAGRRDMSDHNDILYLLSMMSSQGAVDGLEPLVNTFNEALDAARVARYTGRANSSLWGALSIYLPSINEHKKFNRLDSFKATPFGKTSRWSDVIDEMLDVDFEVFFFEGNQKVWFLELGNVENRFTPLSSPEPFPIIRLDTGERTVYIKKKLMGQPIELHFKPGSNEPDNYNPTSIRISNIKTGQILRSFQSPSLFITETGQWSGYHMANIDFNSEQVTMINEGYGGGF